MTYSEAFEKIKKEFKTTDAKAIKENYAIQVNFTDEDCSGAFYIAVDDGKVYVEPYDYYDRKAMLSADFKVLKDIFTGKISLGEAAEQGKAYIDGEIDSIADIIKTIKKKAAKKATAASKTVKKTVKKATKKAEEIKEDVKEEISDAAKTVKKTAKKVTKK